MILHTWKARISYSRVNHRLQSKCLKVKKKVFLDNKKYLYFCSWLVRLAIITLSRTRCLWTYRSTNASWPYVETLCRIFFCKAQGDKIASEGFFKNGFFKFCFLMLKKFLATFLSPKDMLTKLQWMYIPVNKMDQMQLETYLT